MKLIQFIMNALSITRKAAEQIIKDNDIKINSEISNSYSIKINEKDEVSYKDKILKLQPVEIYLFHKPKGVIVSSKHDDDRDIVYDLIPEDLQHLKYIGRLDVNSEGLLLLTNDANFKNYIENPKNNIEKIYKVRCFGTISKHNLYRLAKPLTIDGVTYNFKAITPIKEGTNSWYQITLTEGKNREIRKVFEYLGHPVSRIIRLSVDKYQLADLEIGELYKIPNE